MDEEHVNVKVTIGNLEFDVWYDRGILPVAGNRDIESHNHALYEVQYIVGGSGTLIVEQAEQPLLPNAWHIIGPGVYHAIRLNRKDPLVRSCFRFSFRPIQRRSPSANEAESREILSILHHLTYEFRTDAGRQRQWIGEIQSEMKARPLGYATRIQSLLTLMLLEIIREVEPGHSLDSLFSPLTKDDLRETLIDDFFDRYKEPLTIGDLAGVLHLSVRQTNRILLEKYRTTFKRKQIDTRVEVAKNLLVSTDMSIQEIVEEVGFSLHRSFGKAFKRNTGLKPNEYRKANRSENRR